MNNSVYAPPTSKSKPLSDSSKAIVDRIIRVDHAGELAADRIYAGQMSVLGKTSLGPQIQHMWDQEKGHLAAFEKMISKRRVRPSILFPLWNVAGFVLGTGSALLGREAAMACTVAVESVITDHYNSQLRTLVILPEYDSDPSLQELARNISKIRDEEMEHHAAGLENDAELAPAYALLSGTVKAGCRAAVWVAERV